MAKKKTRIREARDVDEFREAVVERWHEIYRSTAPRPTSDEISRRPLLDRGEVRRLPGATERPFGASGGRFLGRRPTEFDDFDE